MSSLSFTSEIEHDKCLKFSLCRLQRSEKTENRWNLLKIATIGPFLFLFIRCGQSLKKMQQARFLIDFFSPFLTQQTFIFLKHELNVI